MEKNILNELQRRAKLVDCRLIVEKKIILVRTHKGKTYPSYFGYDEYDTIDQMIKSIAAKLKKKYCYEFFQYAATVKDLCLRLVDGDEQLFIIHDLHEGLIAEFPYTSKGVQDFLDKLTSLIEERGTKLLAAEDAKAAAEQAKRENVEHHQ